MRRFVPGGEREREREREKQRKRDVTPGDVPTRRSSSTAYVTLPFGETTDDEEKKKKKEKEKTTTKDLNRSLCLRRSIDVNIDTHAVDHLLEILCLSLSI